MDMISWYYCPEENLFRDEDGWIVYDFYRVITPGRFMILKDSMAYSGVEYIQQGGVMYELVFLFEEDEDYE